MAVAKLKASNTADLMKPEEGNDSLDTIVTQTIGTGKDSCLPYFRSSDSSIQWIQLLHALDQQDLPGWPLRTPLKVQMQKCDKCSLEFCSTINHRRHIRVHHRLKKIDKDSTKNRDLLGAFWDKLTEDEAKEILSFKDVALEEVPGSSVIESLTAIIRKPGFSSLPHYCLKAGSALLDIIQARPSRFPLSSEQLFSILDDASEKTFLCSEKTFLSGTAIAMQKYIFDGEAGKIGLEPKNIVACTSFLVEQKLIKAWLADKDAEALRCQKKLMEEEEAEERRQAACLERKRQKKLRQKAKEQRQDEKVYLKEQIGDRLEANVKEPIDDKLEKDARERIDDMQEAEQPCSVAASYSDTDDPETLLVDVFSPLEPFQPPKTQEDVDFEIQSASDSRYTDLDSGHNVERQIVQGHSHRHFDVSQWNMPTKSQWNHVLRQKAEEQRQDENTDVKKRIDDTSADQSCSFAASDSDTHCPEMLPIDIFSSLEPFQPPKIEDADLEFQSRSGSEYADLETGHNVEQRPVHRNSHRHTFVSQWNMPSKSQWNHLTRSQNSLAPKVSTIHKHAIHRDLKPVPIVNVNKKWNRKPKPEYNGESLKTMVQKETIIQPDPSKKEEVLIGCIPVTLGNCSHDEGNNLDGAPDDSSAEGQMRKRINFQEEHDRPDSVQCGTNRAMVKLLRPVSQNGTNSPILIEYEVDRIAGEGEDPTLSSDSCRRLCTVDRTLVGIRNSSLPEENLHPGSLQFPSQRVKAFLEERWKEAIAAEHLELVILPNFEPPGSMGVQNDGKEAAVPSSLDIKKHNILCNAENQLVDVSARKSSTGAAAGKARFKTKPEKNAKLKYIPKHRNGT